MKFHTYIYFLADALNPFQGNTIFGTYTWWSQLLIRVADRSACSLVDIGDIWPRDDPFAVLGASNISSKAGMLYDPHLEIVYTATCAWNKN